MSEPVESYIGLGAGPFRALTWGAGEETVLFLHGLSGVAEVWGPTVAALPATRRYVALDQRHHGQSPSPSAAPSATAMAGDVVGAIQALGSPIHLVGHSMGARIAVVLAARNPERLHSVTVIDIGPEASRANITATVAALTSRPSRFANRDEALAFAFRHRAPTDLDRHIFLARLEQHAGGSLTWRSEAADLAACVASQRARSYWREWRRIRVPALFIHGERSTEVPTAIADKMVRENPGVAFERFSGVGHNIPLLAPSQLAQSLERHWTASSGAAR